MRALVDRWIEAKRRVLAVEDLTPNRMPAREISDRAIVENGALELAQLELRAAEQDLVRLLKEMALPTIPLEAPRSEELRRSLSAARFWAQEEADRWNRCVVYDMGHPDAVVTAKPKRLLKTQG